ncbi:hypothetical protein LWI29_029371 [Acer saccharum]|uniref:Uncharacterized protein n=1 Tax=Acer saccharum TaxID=4024 RepID=A0AA39S0P0_ACESA|nr:hypothetical protein LWI29_029371 [Acer saccharum]
MEKSVAFSPTKRIAVVTGANKGIGLEICRQLSSNGVMVILTARDDNRGREAVKTLHDSGFSDVVFHRLDLMDPSSISSLANFINTQFHKLDILVNNAGVIGTIADAEAFTCLNLKNNEFLSNERAKEVLSNANDQTEEKIDQVVKRFLEDAKEGLLENNGWPVKFPAYVVSKATLNAYTRILANKLPKISINAVSPGYVKTDLNSNKGELTVEEGAKGPVMLALAPDGGPSGLFFDQMELSTF